MSSVGSELLDEIERVSAKRERWKKHKEEMGPLGAALTLAIALMTVEIDKAKEAITAGDAAASIRALKALQNYDGED